MSGIDGVGYNNIFAQQFHVSEWPTSKLNFARASLSSHWQCAFATVPPRATVAAYSNKRGRQLCQLCDNSVVDNVKRSRIGEVQAEAKGFALE